MLFVERAAVCLVFLWTTLALGALHRTLLIVEQLSVRIRCFFVRCSRPRYVLCIIFAHLPKVGFYSDPAKGWIEGVAILAAVLVVAVVTATNDYSKDKQFRALNAVKDDVTVQASGGRPAELQRTTIDI